MIPLPAWGRTLAWQMNDKKRQGCGAALFGTREPATGHAKPKNTIQTLVPTRFGWAATSPSGIAAESKWLLML